VTILPDSPRPWLKHYGSVKPNLEYPTYTLYGGLKEAADQYPDNVAYRFMGKSVKYKTLLADVDRFASALRKKGIGKGDSVLICLPNCPQALHAFYGASRIGAVAAMVHPLSAPNELAFYIKNSGSRIVVTLDAFAGNFIKIKDDVPLETLVVSSMKDGLGMSAGLVYSLTLGRKVPPVPDSECIVRWKDFLAEGEGAKLSDHSFPPEDPAVILYSGGTTGIPKGVMLSSANFNATITQTMEMSGLYQRDYLTVLSAMPMFHGFGLCIGIHMFLCCGGTCILVPRFTPDSYAKLLVKGRPNFIAAVPTLFEHMVRSKHLREANLSCLKGVFVGGDTLTSSLRDRTDMFLRERKCSSILREGYGLTECVTASCLTPKDGARRGSIGIPFPDTYYKIVKTGTTEPAEYGTDGEICIFGPSVMIGYVGEPEENARTLRLHDDGMRWLHTGDIGMMDQDGYIYFRQRLKRMIISSGYNIYPSHVEDIINAHPDVDSSCVIGVPDPIRSQRVKAFVVLKPGVEKGEAVLRSIKDHCRNNVSLYAIPREIEFIDDMPKTRLGKVAFSALEDLELERLFRRGDILDHASLTPGCPEKPIL